jgi:hypothetical protein
MVFKITQVGRRWFQVKILRAFAKDSFYTVGEVEATYSNNYWDKGRSWTFVGDGSRKYRDQLTVELEKYVEMDF